MAETNTAANNTACNTQPGGPAGERAREHAAGAPPERDPAAGDATAQVTAAATAPAAAMDEAATALAELEDRWRRAVADLDNLRKRFERQLADQLRAERARTTTAFLPVLDNLELALQHAQADPASIVVGVQAVREQAVAVLAGLGYRRLDEVGVPFDPARHEAAQIIRDTDRPPGSVAAVLRPGYVDSDGGLLRPATVAVADRPPTGTDAGGEPGDGEATSSGT